MKKIISAIVAFATICTMATSVFAFSRTEIVSGEGASLSGTTITCGDEGFVFSMTLDANASTLKANAVVKTLLEDGWTISDVAGMEGASLSGIAQKPADDPTNPGLIQVGYTTVSAAAGGIGTTDKTVMSFKAVPSESSTFEDLEIIVWTVAKDVDNNRLQQTQTNGSTKYTVVKAAVQEDKTTATIGANGEVTFDYADADAADAKLDGKKVVLGTAYAGNLITADTTVKVTYTPVEGAAETKTFGETLFEKLGVEGFGFLETESITFGIVCDTTMTGTFSFALN